VLKRGTSELGSRADCRSPHSCRGATS
jgi:hypothetical protein